MVAGLSRWHDQHDAAAAALVDVTALPSHALLEAYSVLTRLPGGLAVPAPVAADVLARRFPDAALRLSDIEAQQVPTVLARAGVYGAASYDAIVSLEAAAGGRLLLTLDRRARETYRRLGVGFRELA